jgi:predicted phosphodiesterase
MNKKIAIISDLHCGKGSIAKDFSVGDTANGVVPNFLLGFKEFVKKESLSADYMLVCGDLTHEADEREFELAEKNILECADYLAVPRSNIIVIPGNHDGNWEHENLARQEGLDDVQAIKRKYKHFRALSLYMDQYSGKEYGNLTEAPWFSVHNMNKFTIVAINSGAHDSKDKPVHNGSVNQNTLESLDSWIIDNKVNLQNQCLVFLLHHHPIQYPDLPYEDADFSILNNSAQLMNLATKHDVGFIIHGHKHIPQIKLYKDEVMQPVNVICAGSFSSRLDDRWLQGQGNFFHIMDVSLDDIKVPKGKLISWARYTGHGWINWQQKKLVGVNHVENFGNTLNFQELKNKLKSILTELFSSRDAVKWQMVLEQEENFGYCSSRLIEKVIHSLTDELSFEVHSIEDDKSFLFLKGNT